MPDRQPSITLTDKEQREVRACLDAGVALPDRYRFRLFAPVHAPLLLWQGKTDTRRRRQTLPLATREMFAGSDAHATDATPPDGWSNLLVRADNLLLLSSLLHGPARRAIEDAGGIKLMYIDPPFAVGADYTMPVGANARRARGTPAGRNGTGEEGTKLRVLAYSDQWKQGLNSFLCMIHERLALMRDLLADDGSLYLHCDWRLAPHMRLVLDEVFGQERFLDDIVWHYTGGGRSTRYFSRKHDRLLHYAVSGRWIFNVDDVRVPYKPGSGYARTGITSAAGRHYRPNPLGTPVDDVWDIPMVNPLAGERLDYPTQKPEALLERIIRASSQPGDLVADFFCGSGTLPAVAERLNRRWLAVDSSPLAMHVTRKRLLHIHASLPPRTERRPFVLADMAHAEATDARAHPHGKRCDTRGRDAVPDLDELARFMPSTACFYHEARFPRWTLAYTLSGIQVETREENGCFSLELAGFTLTAGDGAPADGNGRPAAGDRAAAADLFRQDWRSWLDYWSIGIPYSGPSMAEGMENGPLCNRVLWHSAGKRAGDRPALASPLLPVPDAQRRAGEPLALVLIIVDIFANDSRLLLRLATAREPHADRALLFQSL